MIRFNIFSSNIFEGVFIWAQLPGPISPWVHKRNFSTVSEIKKAKNLADEFWREMGERKQRWRNTKIITFLPNRPFPHSTAVSKQKNEVEARVDNFIQITVFCPPMPRLDAFVHRNLMQERSTHSCITAAKWDAHDVENKAGNARRCNPGRQIFINIFLTTPAKKLLSIFFIVICGKHLV